MKKRILKMLSLFILLSLFLPKTTIAQNSPLKGDCIDTAVGCINISNETSFIKNILQWAIGIGGGIAFLLILYSGFIIITSQGDPKKLQAGQELLSSAILGLILLIFSVFILRVIGVDLLAIPGL